MFLNSKCLIGRTSSPDLFFLAKQCKWEQYESDQTQLVFFGLSDFSVRLTSKEDVNKTESSLTEVSVGYCLAIKFSQRWVYSRIRTNSLGDDITLMNVSLKQMLILKT